MPFSDIIDAVLTGKPVPDESKKELFQADANQTDGNSHGLFANVASHLVMVVCKEKGISFEGIDHLDIPKLRNAHAYRANFRGKDGDEFNCMCVSEIPQVGAGSFQFLSGSIDHLASIEGCPSCDYLGGCEACDRAQMAKLAPPGSGLGLRESSDGLARAMGRESLDSLMEFFRSYHEFRREGRHKGKGQPGAPLPFDMPEPIRQLYMADLAVIDFVIGLVRKTATKAADPESAAGKKLAGCRHLTETFRLVQSHLKGFRAFAERVKADPKGMMEHLGDQDDEEDDKPDDE